MKEHLIRLRGGWVAWNENVETSSTEEGPGERISLPRTWTSTTRPRRVRLVREFGAPRLDPDRESLSLRMEQVPGLISARLNGQELALAESGTSFREFPIGPLLSRRNLLILEVEPEGQKLWGVIALVIHDARFHQQPGCGRPGAWRIPSVFLKWGSSWSGTARLVSRAVRPYRSESRPSRACPTMETERESLRQTYQLCRLGFGILSVALLLACPISILMLAVLFGARHLVAWLGNPWWWHWSATPVVWGSLIGTYLLWGRWNNPGWQRRVGLLIVMGLVDVVLWGLDHGGELGLSGGEVGHEWLRDNLGQALGWAEFALIASLSGDVLAHLGVENAREASKSTRALAAIGAVVWLLLFCLRTSWRHGWPLQAVNRLSLETLLLVHGLDDDLDDHPGPGDRVDHRRLPPVWPGPRRDGP